MKKKATWTVGIIAVLCIICFAVMSNKMAVDEASIEMEKVSPKPNAGGEYYAHKAGGTFKKPEAFEKSEEKSSEPENLWVDYEPDETRQLSEEEKQLIEEVISKISIRDSVGITKEEFVAKMERLSEFYHHAPYFSENAELLFDIAQEEGYSEYFFPMIVCVETVGGQFMKGDFNSWNAIERNEEGTPIKTIVYKDGKRTEVLINWRNFESNEESIREFFEKLKECKTYDSVTTLTEFTAKYAPNTEKYPHMAEMYAINLYGAMKRMEDL